MIFQFHALLEGSTPRVWRRFLISDADTVADLMNALMVMFQMMDYHLYHLEEYVPGQKYGSAPKFEKRSQIESGMDFAGWGPEPIVADDYHLKRLVSMPGQQFRFFYDYGDDWTVRIKLEAILNDDEYDGNLPAAIKGKGAGIIEDCGGVWSLNNMMQEEKAYGAPDDEDSLLIFDKDAVNNAL